jgi:uncharacterized protein
VEYTWDEAKRATNLAKHGVDFAIVQGFDWLSAITEPDRRRNYGEERARSTGLIGDRLFVLIHTLRGAKVRIISLRAANRKETLRYAESR